MNKYLLSLSIIFALLLFSNQLLAQTYLISAGGTINTCSGTLYDSGGPSGNYGNNEDYTITICSETGGSIELFFSQFDLESATYDNLTIYDGPNTGSPLLVPASGSTSLQGETIESTGSCLTLVWDTDGSITYSGFAAEISCGYPCQDYSIDIVNTVPGLSDPDSVWIDVCLGETITFSAQGTYPNNNQDYSQSDATTNWFWSISSSSAPYQENGLGMTDFTYTFDELGGYFVNLYAIDYNGCIVTWSGEIRIRVSIPPSFSNITQDQIVVCPNEEVNFTGNVSTNSWVMSITDEQVVQECITDDQGVSQEFCWNVSAFEPGQTITSGDDLESVCMNIEHSWVADVWIYIQCPNGQQAEINYYSTSNPCSGDEFGEPNQSDNCVPGVGYDYCWTMDATISHTDWCDDVGGNIPAGDYLPTGDFNSLVGCPINGEWCVVIIDDWVSDDGTLFSVSLNFDNAIAPASMWSYNHTYDPDDIVWSGNGIEPNSGGNATAYPDTPGDQTYTFSVTDNFGCTYDTTLTVNVLDFDDPTCCTQPFPEAGNDTSLCQNYFTFNAVTTAGNTVNWTMVSGPGNAVWQNQNSPNATVTVDEWGAYTFELYEENLSPACSDTEQITVEFWSVPTAQFNYTPALCYGDVVVVNYTGNASPTAIYSWDFDYGNINSGSGGGPYQIVWDTAGIHEVSLQVTENGCSSNDTVVQILNPEELVYDLTVIDDPCYQSCNGRAILEVSGGTVPYEYSWGSPTNILSNLCEGDYVVTVTDANDCEVSANFSITQPPELVITDTSYTHVSCFEANDATMSISVEGGTGSYIYQWTGYGNAGPIISDVSAGNYWVSVTDENDCEVVEFFQIYQPDELQVVISNSISICEGQSLNVTAQQQGGTPPYTYYWDDGNGIFEGPPTLNVTPDLTTTYSVYVVDVRGCVSNTASMTITVSPTLVIEDLLLEDNLCYHSCDGRAELVLAGGIPPLSYSWSSPTNVLSDICAGLYQVTVTDAIGCQVNTHFMINEPDTLSYIISTEDATCYNYDDGEAVINVAGGTLPYNYLWPNGETSNTMTNGAGNYQVTVTDDNDCRIVANAQIGQPSQMLIQSLGNRQICIGQSTNIGAQVTGGSPYYNFYWQGSDGTSYNSHLFQVSPVETTTYNVTVTDSHSCTAVKQNITVNVYPELEISAIVTSYDTVCEGEPAIIIVDVIGGNGGPYQLQLDNGQIVASPFSIYPEETSYIHITASDNCGTPSVSDSIKITVMPTPPNVFTSDRIESCAPGLISFSELSPNQGQFYLWNFGDNGFANIKNPTHIYRNEGTFDVSLTVKSDYGCENTRIIQEMITIHPKPIASFYMEPENTTILKPEVQFTNLSVDAFQQFWFFGDGYSSLYVNPRHTYAEMGEYEIKLIVESEHGCMDTTYRTLFIEGVHTFYAPETFTPNGDGVNDCFRVCGTGIDPNHFKMVIYDRWGNRVFYSEEYNIDAKCDACSNGAWDGTNNGDRNKGDAYLPTGNYTWHCEYKDWNGITYEKNGLVRIVR
jgi:gliding motility-associated-like protein